MCLTVGTIGGVVISYQSSVIVNPQNKCTLYKHKHPSAAGEVSNLAFPLVYS